MSCLLWWKQHLLFTPPFVYLNHNRRRTVNVLADYGQLCAGVTNHHFVPKGPSLKFHHSTSVRFVLPLAFCRADHESVDSEFGANLHCFGFAVSPNSTKVFVAMKPIQHAGGILTYDSSSF